MTKFKDLNVKPFIDKNNRYQSALFCPKFAAAFTKILHIKDIQWTIKHHQSQVLYGQSFDHLEDHAFVCSFRYGQEVEDTGYLLFSPPLCQSLIHRLLGGQKDSGVAQLPHHQELTALDRKTLASLYPPLQLCLREALTPLLLLGDAIISDGPHPRDFGLNRHDSYFFEVFKAQHNPQVELAIILRVKAF